MYNQTLSLFNKLLTVKYDKPKSTYIIIVQINELPESIPNPGQEIEYYQHPKIPSHAPSLPFSHTPPGKIPTCLVTL